MCGNRIECGVGRCWHVLLWLGGSLLEMTDVATGYFSWSACRCDCRWVGWGGFCAWGGGVVGVAENLTSVPALGGGVLRLSCCVFAFLLIVSRQRIICANY